MSPQQYEAAQAQLLTRHACLTEHRNDLAIVKAEAAREVAGLEAAIAEDEHQIEDLAIMISAHWGATVHFPEVTA